MPFIYTFITWMYYNNTCYKMCLLSILHYMDVLYNTCYKMCLLSILHYMDVLYTTCYKMCLLSIHSLHGCTIIIHVIRCVFYLYFITWMYYNNTCYKMCLLSILHYMDVLYTTCYKMCLLSIHSLHGCTIIIHVIRCVFYLYFITWMYYNNTCYKMWLLSIHSLHGCTI